MVLRAVEHAGSAVTGADHGRGLQSVGEDDVGVHGRHVQMINDGELLAHR